MDLNFDSNARGLTWGVTFELKKGDFLINKSCNFCIETGNHNEIR